jgi:hypothetical protein
MPHIKEERRVLLEMDSRVYPIPGFCWNWIPVFMQSRVLLESDSRVSVFGTLQGRSFALCISIVEVPLTYTNRITEGFLPNKAGIKHWSSWQEQKESHLPS